MHCLDSFAGNDEALDGVPRQQYDACRCHPARDGAAADGRGREAPPARTTLRHQIEELTAGASAARRGYDALRAAAQACCKTPRSLEAGLETAIGCLYGDESCNGRGEATAERRRRRRWARWRGLTTRWRPLSTAGEGAHVRGAGRCRRMLRDPAAATFPTAQTELEQAGEPHCPAAAAFPQIRGRRGGAC